MSNRKNFMEKVLEELAPGTLFRGFFLVSFDPTIGRIWYFNMEDELNEHRERNSASFYPSLVRYFQTPIEKLEPLSLNFTDGTEMGLIMEVVELDKMPNNPVAMWYLPKVAPGKKILAVEAFLFTSHIVGTFLVEVDEAKKKVGIV